MRVAFDLENVGVLPGAEIAQVYASDLRPRVFREPQSLVGFAKAELQPGQTKRLVIDVDADDLRYWDRETGSWRLDETTISIRVGSSSRDIRLEGTIDLRVGEAGFPLFSREGDGHAAPECYENVSVAGFDDASFARLYGTALPAEKPARPIDINSTVTEIDQTALGHLVFKFIERKARKTAGSEGGDTKAILDAMLADMPLRSITMGGMPMEAVHAIVDLLNGHYVRGVRAGLDALRIMKGRRAGL